MEFSPSAEANSIYADSGNDWFKNAGDELSDDEGSVANRGLTRPIADNIILLLISPQYQVASGGGQRSEKPSVEIAPGYEYDSAEVANRSLRGGPGGGASQQGTQHLLPPLVRVVVVAVDETSAARMDAKGEGDFMKSAGAGFSKASELDDDLRNLERTLNAPGMKLNYRIFSTTIALNDVD